jgi:hypothetical protein
MPERNLAGGNHCVGMDHRWEVSGIGIGRTLDNSRRPRYGRAGRSNLREIG